MFSALTVLVLQGSLTLVGMALGSFLPDAHVAALTATGGLMLVGIALRLLRIREDFPVAAMLPALVVAPDPASVSLASTFATAVPPDADGAPTRTIAIEED